MKKYLIQVLSMLYMLIAAISGHAQHQPLSLKDALQSAAKGNRPLHVQIMERIKAREAVQEAQSFRKPSVSANASYTIYSELPVIYLRNESSSPKVNDIKYGGRFALYSNISAQYPILNPMLSSNVRLAKLTEMAENNKVRTIEESISYEITRTYLSLLMNTEQKSVLYQSLQRNERALADSRAFFLQGKSLKTDTLSHYIAVQNLKVAISGLENEHSMASSKLNLLMGAEEGTVYELTDKLIDHEQVHKLNLDSSTVTEALKNRKDLKLLQTDLALAKEQALKFKSAFKPQLSMVASYEMQSQTDDMKFGNSPLARTSFVGLKLSIPVYSGGKKKVQNNISDLTISQKELMILEMNSQIMMELSNIEKNYQQALSELEIQQASVEASQIKYNILYNRYSQGLASRLELDDAELTLTKSRLSWLQASMNIKLLTLEWERATGVLTL
ncbi:MAG TPA: TolC family protein [Chitinophagaceae bacterium]|nr:TolC family protein [Chitinophagaceae bacterium]